MNTGIARACLHVPLAALYLSRRKEFATSPRAHGVIVQVSRSLAVLFPRALPSTLYFRAPFGPHGGETNRRSAAGRHPRHPWG